MSNLMHCVCQVSEEWRKHFPSVLEAIQSGKSIQGLSFFPPEIRIKKEQNAKKLLNREKKIEKKAKDDNRPYTLKDFMTDRLQNYEKAFAEDDG